MTIKFRKRVGYFPNIARPKKYHEKMYWRKIFDRNPLFIIFGDKQKTKQFFHEKIPELEIIWPVWCGKKLDGAAYKLLDNKHVLKANHGSGRNLFPDKLGNGQKYIEKIAARWMKTAYGKKKLEWAYQNAERYLYIEKIIKNDSGNLMDIYIRAAMGKILQVSVLINNKTDISKFGYFNEHGERLSKYELPGKYALPTDFSLPANFNEAISHARKISTDMDYVRVDFMSTGEQLYAGEITVYPNAGLTRAKKDPDSDMNELTNKGWDIRNSYFFRCEHHWLLEYYKSALLSELSDSS
jgi:hypothetical protein